MYICVDFDGTIVDHRYPEIGKEVPGAIKWLKRWQELGAKLILWTMRSDSVKEGPVLLQASCWLEGKGIKLFAVNDNPDQSSWSASRKVYAPIYVDDAAFGCPLKEYPGFARLACDWDIIGPTIEARLLGR